MEDARLEQARQDVNSMFEVAEDWLRAIEQRTEPGNDWLKAFGALDSMQNSLSILRAHTQAAAADRNGMVASSVKEVPPPMTRRGK